MKMKWSFKKFITNLWCAITIVFIAWSIINCCEIICKNTNPNPTYSEANLIVKLVEGVN